MHVHKPAQKWCIMQKVLTALKEDRLCITSAQNMMSALKHNLLLLLPNQ